MCGSGVGARVLGARKAPYIQVVPRSFQQPSPPGVLEQKWKVDERGAEAAATKLKVGRAARACRILGVDLGPQPVSLCSILEVKLGRCSESMSPTPRLACFVVVAVVVPITVRGLRATMWHPARYLRYIGTG
jgi:hypothetical protein